MEFEFDKEMDSLLRQAAGAAQSGKLASGSAVSDPKSKIENSESFHIDADEISLFAENALPVKARLRVTEHLADCDRCRKVLSNLILLNDETQSENLHAKETEIVAPALPWYKKLFVFPQIAYAMGALALLFSGVIGLMVLQSARESQNSSVAKAEKMEERQKGPSGMSSDGDTSSSEIYSTPSASSNANAPATTAYSSNSSMSNSSTTANTSVDKLSKPAAPIGSPNSNAATSSSTTLAKNEDSKSEPKPAESKKEVSAADRKEDKDKASDAMAKEKSDLRAEEEVTVTNSQVQNLPSVAQNQVIVPDSRNVRELPSNGRRMRAAASPETVAGAAAPPPAKPAKSADNKASGAVSRDKAAEEARKVSGKTFKYANGVWYDSAYNQQKTTNLRRGTGDYKKLDSDLRAIAENIGGTVVVIWKGKAYRIQ